MYIHNAWDRGGVQIIWERIDSSVDRDASWLSIWKIIKLDLCLKLHTRMFKKETLYLCSKVYGKYLYFQADFAVKLKLLFKKSIKKSGSCD